VQSWLRICWKAQVNWEYGLRTFGVTLHRVSLYFISKKLGLLLYIISEICTISWPSSLAIRKVDKVIFFYKEIKVTKQLISIKICGVLSTQSFEKAPRIHWFSRLFSKQTWKAPANEFVFNHLHVFFLLPLNYTEQKLIYYATIKPFS